MARRSRAEMLDEFHRLYNILDRVLEFENRDLSANQAVHKMSLIRSREQTLRCVDAREFTLSQANSGTREAINDFSCQLLAWQSDADPAYASFLAWYRGETGREFFSDMPNPLTLVRAVLRSGRIESEEEYRLIEEMLCDLDQVRIAPDDVAQLRTLQANFRP